MLQTAYDRALTPDKDSGAKPSPAAAVNAVVGMARITGQIIDRREVSPAGAFDGMTDEELVAEAVRRARELGIAGPRLVEDENKKPL